MFARAVIAGVNELRRVAGVDAVGLRVGIHSGPVVGGVIGATRMAYDYWGDTVNIAARLQNTAPVNGVAISESTWLRARDRSGIRCARDDRTERPGRGDGLPASFEPMASTDDDEAAAAA